MTVPPEKVPSEASEKKTRGIAPIEIAACIAAAFCLVAGVVPQVQKFAERYEYAAAMGDGATYLMNALMIMAVVGGVIMVAARVLLKSERGWFEHGQDEDEAAPAG